MDEKNDRLKKLVNSSGYLFQLKVEHEVRTAQKETLWSVLAHEYAWRNKEEDTEGFIDLVLGQATVRLVIECKRPKDRAWVFLTSEKRQERVDRFRLCWTYATPDHRDVIGWADYHMKPESPESEFCVVRTREDKEPFLERLARSLLSSTEALAREEMDLDRPSIHGRFGLLIPAIVTAAELRVC